MQQLGMNSTLEWVESLRESKMYHLAAKRYKNRLFRCILRIQYPPACFIVLYIVRYIAYRTGFDFARMQMYFKSETRELAVFRSKNRKLTRAWF
jgi:hypothetical protein